MKTLLLTFLQTKSKTWNQNYKHARGKEETERWSETTAGLNRVSKWNVKKKKKGHDGRETKTRNSLQE